MANSRTDSTNSAADGYKQTSLSVQNVGGKRFIQKDVCPQAGDAILDLGCGTGQLSAYLAELVGPKGKVIGVDPDKERIKLAQQSYGEIQNLSFVEGSASHFPGIALESYDIIFSNQVLHWIPDKRQIFKNMYESLKAGGKIAVQYVDHEYPFLSRAFIELNPENEQRIHGMVHFEERSTIEQYCSSAGFEILTSYDTDSSALVFESSESFLKWLWSTTHGVFDLSLVTEERLQRYLHPYEDQEGKPCLDFRGNKFESANCRLIGVKKATHL